MANSCIPDARYAHRDAYGNTVYHMSDKTYEQWHKSSGFSCQHEDVNKNNNYRHAYNADN
jgi:hypothetical protein